VAHNRVFEVGHVPHETVADFAFRFDYVGEGGRSFGRALFRSLDASFAWLRD
jgi:hypothetical protein